MNHPFALPKKSRCRTYNSTRSMSDSLKSEPRRNRFDCLSSSLWQSDDSVGVVWNTNGSKLEQRAHNDRESERESNKGFTKTKGWSFNNGKENERKRRPWPLFSLFLLWFP